MSSQAVSCSRAKVKVPAPPKAQKKEEWAKAELAGIERLDNLTPVFASLAHRTGFKIELGEKSCLKPAQNTLVIGLAQERKLGITSPAGIDFGVFHELGHFAELCDDPEGYLNMINECKSNKSRGHALFELYNLLSDIYANTNTANIAPTYRDPTNSSDFAALPKQIYRENLFKQRDFSNHPQCMQFAYYLLNLGMHCADDITLSPTVKALVDSGIETPWKVFSYETFIDTYLRPVLGYRDDGFKGTISERKMLIDMFIRPEFEKLLTTDEKSGKNKQISKGEGDLGDMSQEVAEEIAKEVIRRNHDSKMTTADKTKGERRRQAKQIARKAGLSEEEAKGFADNLENMQPTIQDLVRIWESLRKAYPKYVQVTKGHFPTGTDLDVQQAIEVFSNIQRCPQKAEIMTRELYEENIEYQPRIVEAILVVDLSDTMETSIEQVRELCVGLSASLASSNQKSKSSEIKLDYLLSIIGYNENAIPIISPAQIASIAEIAKGYKKISASGDTCSHTALQVVFSSLTPEKIKAIARGDLIVFMVEITDGDTMDPAESRRLVDNIEKLGVKVAGIRFDETKMADKNGGRGKVETKRLIPGPNAKDTFDTIWNHGTTRLRGHRIASANQIAPKLKEVLAAYISDDSNRNIRICHH